MFDNIQKSGTYRISSDLPKTREMMHKNTTNENNINK